jgi:hypothetical protein
MRRDCNKQPWPAVNAVPWTWTKQVQHSCYMNKVVINLLTAQTRDQAQHSTAQHCKAQHKRAASFNYKSDRHGETGSHRQ